LQRKEPLKYSPFKIFTLAREALVFYDNPMNENARHYLDWAATAMPCLSAEPPVSVFGNPSSVHEEGRRAKDALESARSRCAQVLGVSPDTLIFTSGGTESNALVLHSFLLRKMNGRLLYSAVEHPSVRENCTILERLGNQVSTIAVEKDGRVSAETFGRALEKYPDARFAAVMAVNNETGAIMDMKALGSLLRQHEAGKNPHVHLHCDMVQALGKIPLDMESWNLDSASFSAHKLGGPRGIGLLYLKKSLASFYAGGKQEKGIRPGTENVAGALAMAGVLEMRAQADIEREEELKAKTRFKYLIGELGKMKRCILVPEDRGEDDPRFSPWILQAAFRGVPGEVMVRALDENGIAISTGSACSSASQERPVLAAMGLDGKTRLEGVRISQGWSTNREDLDALLIAVEKLLSYL